MLSPENGQDALGRRLLRQLASLQPHGFDVGDDVLCDMAQRLARGERVVAPWPATDPASELQCAYGLSRATAYSLLDRYARREGRRYVLDAKARAAIDQERQPTQLSRALVAWRMAHTNSRRDAAERWVRRYLARNPRAADAVRHDAGAPIDARDPAVLERAIADLSRAHPGMVRIEVAGWPGTRFDSQVDSLDSG